MKKTAAEKKHLSFYDHLTELRQRLIRCLIFVALIFLCMLPFSDQIYTLFSSPMSQALNESSMIAIGVTSPFLAPIKLCLYLALIFSLPFCFYQAWVYASPGLYQSEKNLAKPIFIMVNFLFFSGIIFSYLVVAPVITKFFVSSAPSNIKIMTDINQYLSFMMKLIFGFGLAFQVPIITNLLIRTGIKSKAQITNMRPYLIILFLILAMLLTPPDIFSQLFLAVPMWLLFELGLALSRDKD